MPRHFMVHIVNSVVLPEDQAESVFRTYLDKLVADKFKHCTLPTTEAEFGEYTRLASEDWKIAVAARRLQLLIQRSK